ncbi:MAG: hypothetical protein IJ593_00850 [Lachnospiraceae bacterium]|nr:hypothetical protein [Lachnospiraceae bacterium]
MENESREVIYLSISLILAALVISFIVFGLNITHQITDVRSNETISNERVEEYRRFSLYDRQTINGDDVIELIRKEYDSGVTIFVDYRKNTNNSSIVDDDHRVCTSCSGKGGDHRYFNTEMYLLHKDSKENNYFAITKSTTENTQDLRKWFKTEDHYQAFLVFNDESVVQVCNSIKSYYNSNKGSVSSYEQKINVLNTGAPRRAPTDQITGIVLINLEHLGITKTV